MTKLLKVKEKGLYCPAGDFYIDAWKEVPLCLLTHGHGDHARPGSANYIATKLSLEILKIRLGKESSIQTFPYGEKFKLGQVWVSFHPAGHILGSAQIRIESSQEVVVVSGDYKLAFDESCTPFESVPCNTFVTESTFALPIFQWPDQKTIAEQIFSWWQENAAKNVASVLFCYSLGKAQRLLTMLRHFTQKTVYVHGSIAAFVECYRQAGVSLLPIEVATDFKKGHSFKGELILAPPSTFGSIWIERFSPYKSGCASGWMAIRGNRRRAGYDRGFILSDHADWDALLLTIANSKAQEVLVTHGSVDVLTKYLQEKGTVKALPLHGIMGEFAEDEFM